MKKLLSLLVLMTISANLWAVQAVIDGIKYEILKKAGQIWNTLIFRTASIRLVTAASKAVLN